MTPYIYELRTNKSIFEIYSVFKDEEYSFILESSMNSNNLGRYSFVGFNPIEIISYKDDKIIRQYNNEKEEFICTNPLNDLGKTLDKYSINYKGELPFIGGAVGFLSYDFNVITEDMTLNTLKDISVPGFKFGIYDGIIVCDHKENKMYIVSVGFNENKEKIVNEIIKRIDNRNIEECCAKYVDMPKDFKSNMSKEYYLDSLDKVKNYIEIGDVYQINMTQRFECKMSESPYELYKRLREINPAPFSCFMDYGEGHIVSSSPERFIQVRGGKVQTRPIKGTRPRTQDEKENIIYRKELENSEKDKSELLMIVDLERNDLSKIAKKDSVDVTELFTIEEYPTVFHLVSTVEAKLRNELKHVDVIKATFPGGSITGAPKRRAMEIIDELEPTNRNIYTGSIGYIGFNGDMDLNIVIRTILCKDEKAYFQVGGGIVWDSDHEFEYEETLQKAYALMRALEGKRLND